MTMQCVFAQKTKFEKTEILTLINMSVLKVIIFVAMSFCYTQNNRVLAQRNTCTVRATARYREHF